MRSGLLPALLGAAAVAAGAAPASALSTYFDEDVAAAGTTTPPTTFSNSSTARDQFLLAIGASQTENFSSFSIGHHDGLDIFVSSSSSGPITGRLTDGVEDGGSIRGVLDDAVNRGFATSSDQFWKNETTDTISDDLFRVDFNMGVRAFGFFATAYSTESTPTMDATSLVLYLELAGGGVVPIPIDHTHLDRPGSVFYLGVTSADPFVAVYLRNNSITDPGDRIGFDDFTVALVPEPSTALLLGAGLLGLAATRRRAARVA